MSFIFGKFYLKHSRCDLYFLSSLLMGDLVLQTIVSTSSLMKLFKPCCLFRMSGVVKWYERLSVACKVDRSRLS